MDTSSQIGIDFGRGNTIQVDGDIVGRDKIIGYTAEKVSLLLTQISTTFQPKPFDGRCPYVGLAAFAEQDADRFFGRERLVADLLGRVKQARFVVIAGPSGSGKSSLVRAGLIPTLRQGALPSSERWLYESLKPGRNPFDELARVTSSLASTLNAGDDIRTKGKTDPTVLHQWAEIALKDDRARRAVILVDQFEEIFTQVTNEDERVAFLNLLTHASTIENGRAVVLFTLRSDFVTNCAAYLQLNALINQEFMQIGSMQSDELVSAIALPALQVGLRIDPDLIAQIVNDMRDEPGALPLMQFALQDLFNAQQEKGGVIALTLADYMAHGGIRKALERHADAKLESLTESDKSLARSVFMGLMQVKLGMQATRRTATFAELVPAGADAAKVEIVIRKLADARLVTTDESSDKKNTATLAHERLIEAWPWLQRLVNENRESIALQNQINEDAQIWDKNNRDASYLYTGARLDRAHEQRADKRLVLSGLAQAFIDEGIAAKEAELRAEEDRQQRELEQERTLTAEQQRRAEAERQRAQEAEARVKEQELARKQEQAQARRLRLGTIGLAVALLVAIGAGVWALIKQQEAHSSALAASAQLALNTGNGDLAIALALEANNPNRIKDPPKEAKRALADVAFYAPGMTRLRLDGHTAGVNGVAFSPNGQTALSASADKTLILWDIKTGKMIRQLKGHTAEVTSVAFHPKDNHIALSGSADKTLILWNLTSGTEITRLVAHTDTVTSVAFSPDGRIAASGSADKTVILWDLASGKLIHQFSEPTGAVTSVSFNPDQHQPIIAATSTDDHIYLWDNNTSEQTQRIEFSNHGVTSVAFSPDGKNIFLGAGGWGLGLWSIVEGRWLRGFSGHTSGATSVAFSPDGCMAVSASNDKSLILWNINDGAPLQRFLGHTGDVMSVAFSPNGRNILSGSSDSSLRLWDIGSGAELQRINCAYSFALSPDGETVLYASVKPNSEDNRLYLWNIKSNVRRRTDQYGDYNILITFSPNGKTALLGWENDGIHEFNIEEARITRTFKGRHPSWINNIVVSSDGSKVLSSSNCKRNPPQSKEDCDDTLLLWDFETGEIIHHLNGHIHHVWGVAFSPDSTKAVSTSADQTIILWDVNSGQMLHRFTGHTSHVNSVAFSPDGSKILSGSGDLTMRLWDINTGQEIHRLVGHTAGVSSAIFSPDGRMALSGSADFNLRLWDIETGEEIERFLGHNASVKQAIFRPDGRTILSRGWTGDDTIRLWQLPPQDMVEWTRKNRYVRELTCEERVQYRVEPLCN